jgi:hypothetical protein
MMRFWPAGDAAQSGALPVMVGEKCLPSIPRLLQPIGRQIQPSGPCILANIPRDIATCIAVNPSQVCASKVTVAHLHQHRTSSR